MFNVGQISIFSSMNKFLGLRVTDEEYDSYCGYKFFHVPEKLYDMKENKIGILARLFAVPFFFFYPFYKIMIVAPFNLVFIFFLDLFSFVC